MISATNFALLIKPFAAFLLCIPGAIVVWWIRRKMKDGWLKRFLLISWRT